MAQCRVELWRIFHVENGDRHLNRGRFHFADFPGVKRQFDTRLARSDRFRDLNQILQAVASAALLERVLVADRCIALALGRERDVGHRVDIGRDGVGIENETERAGTDALRADADLKL